MIEILGLGGTLLLVCYLSIRLDRKFGIKLTVFVILLLIFLTVIGLMMGNVNRPEINFLLWV